jgi:hypothetical protein
MNGIAKGFAIGVWSMIVLFIGVTQLLEGKCQSAFDVADCNGTWVLTPVIPEVKP